MISRWLRVSVLVAAGVIVSCVAYASDDASHVHAQEQRAQVAPSESDAHVVLDRAFDAMGGRDLLANLRSLKLDLRTVRYRVDDSERADGPYWLDIGVGTRWTDEDHGRNRLELDDASAQWPLDLVEFDGSDMVAQGVMWQGKRFWLASVPPLIDSVALQPERILLTAATAPDLRVLPDQVLHHQPQHVLAFTFEEHRVRLYVDTTLYLPSRLEIVGARKGSRNSVMLGDIVWDTDYLFYKRQPDGLVYPHQIDLSRNGRPYSTTVITGLVQNPPPPAGGYEPPASAKLTVPDPNGVYGDQPIDSKNVQRLARDVWLIKGPWYVIMVRQPDGIVVIEAPQSGAYSAHVLGLIAKRFPGMPVKALISTTDSTWHIAGVRTYVARGIPVYVLDANEARLRRLIDSPRMQEPDELALHPKPTHLIPVDDATSIGTGATRLMIYPIRGHGDERMMMVYFPGLHLLYGSSNDVNLQQKPNPRATFNAFELVRRVDMLKLSVHEYVAIHTGELSWEKFRDMVLTQPAISSR